MKVLMEGWRKFITEAQPKEASKNMDLYLEEYPGAKNSKRRDLFAKLVKQRAPKAQEQIRNTYSNKKNANSFVRFIQGIKGYENKPREEILSNWETYRNTALSALSVPVVAFHERIDEVPADYVTRRVGAFYDTDKKVIFVNPFVYMRKGGLNHGAMFDDIKEEYIHAAQSFIRRELKMPVAQMQTRAAKKADIFVSQEQSGLKPAIYDYLTTPAEFHAKMLRLKSNIAKESPESFDATGIIRKDVLLKLMQSPNPPEILRVLDPNKIDKVMQFFNMVATGKTQKTSEMA